MKLYIMYGLIILVNLIIFIIMKDKIKALRLTGIITLLSAILLIVLSFVAKIIISNSVTAINLSSVVNYLFKKFVNSSLILFLIGLIEIIISKYIYTKKKASAQTL